MTLKDLSQMTLDALQICIEEGVKPDDVPILSGDSCYNSEQISRTEMRVAKNDHVDKCFAIFFITIND